MLLVSHYTSFLTIVLILVLVEVDLRGFKEIEEAAHSVLVLILVLVEVDLRVQHCQKS